MWKFLSKDPSYFIMFLEENMDYYIGVTNFQQYWSNHISRSNFLQELKQSNEGLEFDDDNELLERGITMLKHSDSLKSVRISQVDEKKILKLVMTKSFEITLRLELSLMQGDHQSLFEMVVQPLLQTICDLRSSQDELRHLLLKKDREIEEYKIEGKAPRRLITTIYNDAEHMSKHTTYEELFTAPNVPDILKAVASSSHFERKTPHLPKIGASSCNSSVSTNTKQSSKTTNSYSTIIKTEPTSQTSNGLPESSTNNISILPTEDIKPIATVENVTTSTSDNINNPPLEIIPKIEKTSQNSLTEETNSMLPTNVETEVQIPKTEVKKCEEISPAKKRQRKRLNY